MSELVWKMSELVWNMSKLVWNMSEVVWNMCLNLFETCLAHTCARDLKLGTHLDRCLNLGETCLNLSETCLNLSETCLNLPETCLNLSETSLNLSETCLNLSEFVWNMPELVWNMSELAWNMSELVWFISELVDKSVMEEVSSLVISTLLKQIDWLINDKMGHRKQPEVTENRRMWQFKANDCCLSTRYNAYLLLMTPFVHFKLPHLPVFSHFWSLLVRWN